MTPERRWDDFRYFLSVAKNSSIKRAAAELNTTQSAVSKRLDRLEKALSVRLLDRGPTGTKLTYQGKRILNHALSAEIELERALEGAQAAESRVEGDCSILLGDGVANYWLPPFLETFFGHYPNIELKMILDHDLTAPRNDVFDIRLHYQPPDDADQVSKPLSTVHFVPFASRDYVAAHGMPQSVADLSGHRLIDQSLYLISRGAWSQWFDAPMKRTSIFTNQSAFLARTVLAGVGIALMPTYMVLTDPSLVPLKLPIHFPLDLFASYHRERAQKQAVRTTLDFLRTRIFDARRMPWFSSDFIVPDASWAGLQRDALERARLDGAANGTI